MRNVFFLSECINNQIFNTIQFLFTLFRNIICISYICKITHSETVNWQAVMEHSYRDYLKIIDIKTMFRNRNKSHFRNTRVLIFRKNIGIFLFNHLLDSLFGVNVDSVLAFIVESPYIIQPCYMIFVFMSQNYCIEFRHMFSQHLLAEVRSGINNQCSILRLQKYRSPESFIVQV